jgi:hypothetical protein
MIGFGRQFTQGAQSTFRSKYELGISFEAHALYVVQARSLAQAVDDFQQAVFTLAPNHHIDKFSFQGLIRKERWMPAS